MCGECLDNHCLILLHTKMRLLFELQIQLDRILANCLSTSYGIYIIVILFRFNAMSQSLNAYIFFCQIMSCPLSCHHEHRQ